ncbi:MAG: sulfite exporter TauE/SafE family protein [Dehalococcoidia bacterium]
MTAASLVGVGFLAGSYGVIIGAGGGFIIAPLLLLLYGLAPAELVGTTLAIVALSTTSGLLAFARQKRIDYKLGLPIIAGGIPGAMVGTLVLGRLSQATFEAILGLLLLVMALALALTPQPPRRGAAGDISGGPPQPSASPHGEGGALWVLPLVGFAGGIMAGLLGVGGGFLLAPLLVYVMRRPPHVAVATSLFCLLPYVLPALAVRWSYGDVRGVDVLFGGIGVVIGAQVGALASQHVPGAWLMRLLAVALVVPAVQLIVRSFT